MLLNSERFGLHWVNFTDPGRERIPKKSVKYIRKVFLSKGFPYPTLPWSKNKQNQCELDQYKNTLLDTTCPS